MIANLPREELDKGIITASAGNHAQGVAYSAKQLGIRAVIAMPTVTPDIKVYHLSPSLSPSLFYANKRTHTHTHTNTHFSRIFAQASSVH